MVLVYRVCFSGGEIITDLVVARVCVFIPSHISQHDWPSVPGGGSSENISAAPKEKWLTVHMCGCCCSCRTCRNRTINAHYCDLLNACMGHGGIRFRGGRCESRGQHLWWQITFYLNLHSSIETRASAKSNFFTSQMKYQQFADRLLK